MKTLRHYGEEATSREDWYNTVRNNREEFEAGTMTGRKVYCGVAVGDLPEPYRTTFREGNPCYAVFSYETPIAWYDADTCQWTIPDVNYSVTTTKHQHTVRMAVDTWDGERWQHDYETGPSVNLRTGKGQSPYGPRRGW